MKSITKEHSLCKSSHVLSGNMNSMAGEQMPPLAIARMVSAQSAHHREKRCWKEKGPTGDNNHLGASPLRPWQKGGCHLWRDEKAPLQWAKRRKKEKREGREEGKDKWQMTYKSASKQHFNCIWTRAEATAVNNLCATQTLAQEKWVHDMRTDVSVCMCWGSCNDW